MLQKHLGFCALPITHSGNACDTLALAVAVTSTVTLLLTLGPGAELTVFDATV